VSRALRTLEARGGVLRDGSRFRVKAVGVAEAQATIAESLRRVAQDLARWNEFRAGLARNIELTVHGSAAMVAQVRDVAGMMARVQQQAAEQLTVSFRFWQEGLARTAETFRFLVEGMRRWATATREVHQALVPRGWLIPPQLPMDVWTRLHRILNEKGVDAAEAGLVEIVEELAGEPFGELYAHPAFAPRRRFLEMAREAHVRRAYALAIPMFLAQADGIAIDVFGDELYRARRRRQVRDDIPLEFDLSRTFWTVVADVLSRTVGLKRPVPAGTFTRHVVLHGRSVDYDTQANSAKAILLLFYLQFMVEEEERGRAQASAG